MSEKFKFLQHLKKIMNNLNEEIIDDISPKFSDDDKYFGQNV
jgi:hypothetical protein